jgi:beta-lactamase regulating signal transducer with metallopeptidase domain
MAAALLARQPARAHAAVLLALTGAAIVTVLGALARCAGVGLLAGHTRSLDVADLAARLAGGEGVPVPAGGLTAEGALTAAWLAASAAALARLGASALRARRLLAGARPVVDAGIGAVARRAAARLKLRGAPGLVESGAVTCPVIWCWGRTPRVVLPAGPAGAPPGGLYGVLCHEMAHLKRRDHWTHLAAQLALCALVWNPLAWIAMKRLEQLREECCDAWAVEAGESPVAYAEALLGLARQRAVALAQAAGAGSVGRRIRTILATDRVAPRSGRGFVAAATGLSALLVAGAALGHRRPPTIDVIDSTGEAALHAAPDVIAIPGTLDLGAGAPGEPRSRDLLLCNRSREPRVVFSAAAACACTTVSEFEPTELGPGECMKLEVTMTADPHPGAAKTRYVTFEIEGQAPLKLAVHVRTAGPT